MKLEPGQVLIEPAGRGRPGYTALLYLGIFQESPGPADIDARLESFGYILRNPGEEAKS